MLSSMTSVTPCFHSVCARQPTDACDVDCRAKRLGDEMPCLAVLGRVPMLGLMLELQHRRLPTNTCTRSKRTAACIPGILQLAHYTFQCEATICKRHDYCSSDAVEGEASLTQSRATLGGRHPYDRMFAMCAASYGSGSVCVAQPDVLW